MTRQFSPDSDAGIDERLEAYHQALLANQAVPADATVTDLAGATQCLKLLERVRRQSGTRDSDWLFGNSGDRAPGDSPGTDKVPPSCPDDVDAGRDTGEPRRIGRFIIEHPIGQGGFGIVFRAIDPQLNRRVALKVPRPEAIVSATWRERFLREAEAAAMLDHPGIVPVFEVGRAGSLCYIVQPWCDGTSLDQWLAARGTPLSPRAAARLAQALAETVQHAHSRGVLHRDIKPANILLDVPASGAADDAAEYRLSTAPAVEVGRSSQGDLEPASDLGKEGDSPRANLRGESLSEDQLAHAARLTDFGLARFVDRSGSHTQSGSIVGTPSYMAPEQAEGLSRRIGVTVDVYALGAVLFELLTGQPPFQEESLLATLRAVREQEPPQPRKLVPGIPIDLEAICLKCLEKDEHRRYATARELAEDLSRFIRGDAVTARMIGRRERLTRWCRRNPKLSGLTAAILLLLVVLLAGSITAAMWQAQARQTIVDSLEAEIAAKDRATRSEELALRALFEARMAEARASRSSGLPRGRTEALAALTKAAVHIGRLGLGDDDRLRMRNEAIAAMALVDLRLDCQWPDHPPRFHVANTGFDADVERYAVLAPDGKIAVRRLPDNAELLRLGGLGRPNIKPYTRFSPDGNYLAVRGLDSESQLRVQLWDLSQPHIPLLNELSGGEPTDRSMDFSRDSKRFAFAGVDGRIELFGIPSRSMVRSIDLGWSPSWLRFNPQGNQLAMVNQRGNEVHFLSPVTGQPIARPLRHSHIVGDATWNATGQLLATACADGNAYVWESATGGQLAICRGHHGTIHHVAFDPKHGLLMTSGWGNTVLWEPFSGRAMLRSIERGAGFSRDGEWLALAVPGVVVGRWQVSPRREYFTLSGHLRNAYVYATAYHPDGRLLASVAENDGVRLWDTFRRIELAHLEFDGNAVAFSADGNFLLIGGGGKQAFRVPITTAADGDTIEMRLGTPEMLFSQGWDAANVSFSSDGRTLVTSLNSRTVVVARLNETPPHRVEIKGSGLRFHDLSPDGKLVAVGNWNGTDCTVRNAENGALIKELSKSGSARVQFSPNGRWLASCSFHGCTVWDVEKWEPRYEIEHEGSSYGVAAFSHDNRVVAVTTPNSVKLIDLADGRELATLYPPGELAGKSICFSPDGRQLAVGSRGHVIKIWRLDQVREKLRELDVDWDQPPIPAAPEDSRPLTVHVDLASRWVVERPSWAAQADAEIAQLSKLIAEKPDDADLLWRRARNYVHVRRLNDAVADCQRAIDLQPENRHSYFWRGNALMLLNRWRESFADFRKSYDQRPDDDWCLRHMAWILVGGPPAVRDAAEAQQFAEHAVKISQERKRSNYPLCLAVLGMALYRQGKWETALAKLDEAIGAGAANARIFLFKALCHQQLGDREMALLCYEEALLRIESQLRDDGLGDPRYIRAEAEQLLSIAVQPSGR